jgi:hypothetical protein
LVKIIPILLLKNLKNKKECRIGGQDNFLNKMQFMSWCQARHSDIRNCEGHRILQKTQQLNARCSIYSLSLIQALILVLRSFECQNVRPDTTIF